MESDEKSSTEEVLSVSITNGVYPAAESDRDTNPGASIRNYKLVHASDIVFNSMRMWQGAVGLSQRKGIVSPAYIIIRPSESVDPFYFNYYLKLPIMLHKYRCYSQGNSKDTLALKYEKFSEITATTPPFRDEQCRISTFFRSLDDLITLHQRKQIEPNRRQFLERQYRGKRNFQSDSCFGIRSGTHKRQR